MIQLTDEMRTLIANALADKCPVIAASTDDAGQPHIAFYGSTQVLSDDQLAIWIRDPANSTLQDRVPSSPRMAFLYRNPELRVSWQFHGRARLVDDVEVRSRVYENAPQAERDRDPDFTGKAIVIDVDRVIQRGQVLMEREGER